jgi:hypothetical protein
MLLNPKNIWAYSSENADSTIITPSANTYRGLKESGGHSSPAAGLSRFAKAASINYPG